MFRYILKKNPLIFRDIHALLVLFIMPAVFILIMTLALKILTQIHFWCEIKSCNYCKKKI